MNRCERCGVRMGPEGTGTVPQCECGAVLAPFCERCCAAAHAKFFQEETVKLAAWDAYTEEGKRDALTRVRMLARSNETTSDERSELIAIHELDAEDPRRVALIEADLCANCRAESSEVDSRFCSRCLDACEAEDFGDDWNEPHADDDGPAPESD